MIEILGYITLYLLIGVVVLPFIQVLYIADGHAMDKNDIDLMGFLVLFWFIVVPIAVAQSWWEAAKSLRRTLPK